MTESPIKSSPIDIPEIPVEIVSEEEMALIEAALAATRSSLSSSVAPSCPSRLSLLSTISSSQFQSNAKSTETITFHSKRPLSGCSETQTINDVEDLGNLGRAQKKVKVPKSLLYRFRRKKGLAVTDITSTEWCEKQMEFSLLRGKPKKTKAMEAGTARHEKLEEEVIKKVKIHVKSVEDIWALKLMNFIVGANQLFFEGMTRELPLIGFLEGVWTVGVIDEIRMPSTGNIRNPLLVDTKTRSQATLPSEAQKRNGRLQLMCYKYLWDNVVSDNFPSDHFFDFFRLNPEITLSKEIKEQTASSGFPAQI
ncbi:PREDICTED: exonuclease V, chloroplastic isoform X2 [Nelumbo nucifera]|uniref:Exonuclease V, chloroplastic isoform X2 n=1 Tax=Nelumbo nucifera TaxID=4432 RepID=A0A1U7ZY36_NELNU|nr:PREDICTED: exonuclease V, chloroplastic isoform X2 [Nelumbo nucifera]